MTLALGRRRFAIESATLSGWMNTLEQDYCIGLQWILKVTAVEREFDETWWQPQFSFEFPAHGVGRDGLAGLNWQWDAAHPHDDTIQSGLYIFTHERIAEGDIRFDGLAGGALAVRWSGAGDVHWDKPYRTDVPFALECTPAFTGITVMGDAGQTSETLAAALAAEIPIDGLTQAPLRTIEYPAYGWKQKLGELVLPARKKSRTSTFADFAAITSD